MNKPTKKDLYCDIEDYKNQIKIYKNLLKEFGIATEEKILRSIHTFGGYVINRRYTLEDKDFCVSIFARSERELQTYTSVKE
jgi:hypothetical protein